MSLEFRYLLTNIGRDDLRSRQIPRTYGIWTTSPSDWTDWRALLFKKSHHDQIECESQHQYVCQRPSAALESSERLPWKGCYSLSNLEDGALVVNSNMMTIDFCSNFCRDFTFIGIANTKCLCFESLKNVSRLSNKLCNKKCKGNEGQLCGGKGAMAVHQLKIEAHPDVMVLFGGTETTYNYIDNDPLEDSTVIMTEGRECHDHGIPDLPSPVLEAGFVSINNSVIVMCGGKTSSSQYQPNKGCKSIVFIFIVSALSL